jgi:hypothetical protein
MAYTNIISVQESKDYLGIDDSSRDSEITRIIAAALRYVENKTGHILEPRAITYNLLNGSARVFDFPIISTSNTTATTTESGLSTLYHDSGNNTITLTVGYTSSADIPADLLEAGFMLIKFFFYEQEGSGKMPEVINYILQQHQRFIV